MEACLQGATERLGKGRYDLPWIDQELDPVLKAEIKMFPVKNLPAIYDLLEKHKDKTVFIFHSREETDAYLKQ